MALRHGISRPGWTLVVALWLSLLVPLGAASGQAASAAEESYALRGAVVDIEGQPVSVTVTLYYLHPTSGASWMDQVRSGADGRFAFEGLAPRTYRLCFLTSAASDTESRCYPDAEHVGVAEDIVISDSDVDDIRMVARPATHLRGRVTSGGVPLAGISVAARHRHAGGWFEDDYLAGFTETDADGSFEFVGLRPGAHQVEVSDNNENYLGEFYPDARDPADATTVELSRHESVEGIDVDLEPAGHITGTVITEEGTYLYRPRIWVYCDRPDGWIYCASGVAEESDGAYAVDGLEPGRYLVFFSGAGGLDWIDDFRAEYYRNAHDRADATIVEVGPGATVTGIDAVLERRAYITGRVLDAYGRPLGQVEVTPYRQREDGSWYAFGPKAWTEADGHYVITNAGHGSYCLRFRPESGAYLTTYSGPSLAPATCEEVFVDADSGEVVHDARVPFTRSLRSVSRPRIAGVAEVGRTLRAGRGRWSRTPHAVSYRWFADGRLLRRESRGILVLRPALLGSRIRVSVVAARDGMNPATARSAATRRVRR